MFSTLIADDITSRLGPHAAAAIQEVLAYSPVFRCPVCGAIGDTRDGPTEAVLFTREDFFGGGTSDVGLEIPHPPELTVVEWQLARRHPTCVSPPVLDWQMREPAPAAQAVAVLPPDRMWTPLIPAGRTMMPAVIWQPALPDVRVRARYVHRRLGIWEYRVEDAVQEVLRERSYTLANGVRLLDTTSTVADNLTDVAELDGWYCQITGSNLVTVYLRPSFSALARRRAPGTDPAATADRLCTVDQVLPPAWLHHVQQTRRVLLVALPAGTIASDVSDHEVWAHPALRAGLDREQFVGGLVHAGPEAPERAPAPPRRDKNPAPRPASLIVVDQIWRRAWHRASTLMHAYHRTSPPGAHARPAELLAMVLVAQARDLDCDPEHVDLILLVDWLEDWVALPAYLDVMLAPTTLAHRWRDLRSVRTPWTAADDDDCSMDFAFPRACAAAASAAHRQRLIDRGGLRFGDRVRKLPAEDDRHTDVTGVISGSRWTPYGHTKRHQIRATFETFMLTDAIRGRSAMESDLLLRDDTDPRAPAQAVYCAVEDLLQLRADTHLAWTTNQRMIAPRVPWHTFPPAHDALQAVQTARGRDEYQAALTQGIDDLVVLEQTLPHRVRPQEPRS